MNKKIIILGSLAAILLIFSSLFMLDHGTDNVSKPFICSSVDSNGNIGEKADTFSSNTSKLYLVSKANKFFIKEAVITWYSDTDNKNPIKTENVKVKNGYFISEISSNEGLKSGDFHAYIDTVGGMSRISKEVVNFKIQ